MDPFFLLIIYVSGLSLLFCLVCSLQTCPLGSLVCDIFLYFVIVSYDVSGQVWYMYLIVLIPGICHRPYIKDHYEKRISLLLTTCGNL